MFRSSTYQTLQPRLAQAAPGPRGARGYGDGGDRRGKRLGRVRHLLPDTVLPLREPDGRREPRARVHGPRGETWRSL